MVLMFDNLYRYYSCVIKNLLDKYSEVHFASYSRCDTPPRSNTLFIYYLFGIFHDWCHICSSSCCPIPFLIFFLNYMHHISTTATSTFKKAKIRTTRTQIHKSDRKGNYIIGIFRGSFVLIYLTSRVVIRFVNID